MAPSLVPYGYEHKVSAAATTRGPRDYMPGFRYFIYDPQTSENE